jgi:hypothetical protein
MKHPSSRRFGLLITVMAIIGVCQPSAAQVGSPDNETYYVANTRPPDAFLALRTNPMSGFGQAIAVEAEFLF